MNVRLLERVAAVIQQHPEHFDMEKWANREFVLDKSPHLSVPCGTTACIAGWAVALHDGVVRGYYQEGSIPGRAQDVLELTDWQTAILFHHEMWPDDFEQEYKDAETLQQKAEVAVARINHFIATDGKE